MESIVRAYIELLEAINFNNPIIYSGIREGLNKFLSNAFLDQPGHKYQNGHFYSQMACEKVNKKDYTRLIFEHMIPKHKYIQKPCMEMAMKNNLDQNKVRELINKDWKIAIITKEENSRLRGRTMPKDWDGEDIFRRYNDAGIQLKAKEDYHWISELV